MFSVWRLFGLKKGLNLCQKCCSCPTCPELEAKWTRVSCPKCLIWCGKPNDKPIIGDDGYHHSWWYQGWFIVGFATLIRTILLFLRFSDQYEIYAMSSVDNDTWERKWRKLQDMPGYPPEIETKTMRNPQSREDNHLKIERQKCDVCQVGVQGFDQKRSRPVQYLTPAI